MFKRKSKRVKSGRKTGGGLPLHIEIVKWNTRLRKRFDELMITASYNLNGSHNNALAEALALAVVYKNGQVLAERELVRVSGMDMIAGTPDGAVLLSSGGMVATQVVRISSPKGRGGVRHVLRTLLVKVFKSLVWLLNSGMGHTVSSFIIAAWVPMNLSSKATVALNRLLQSKVGIDSRFQVLLLVPPSDIRGHLFPKNFGKKDVVEEESIVQGSALMKSICSFTKQCEAVNTEGDVDLGFLADLLLADGF